MSGTITDRYDDLRKELADFCRTMDLCQNCVLHVPCECGRGTHFMRKWGNRNMSDEEVIEAYEIVFGGAKTPTQDMEPLSDADFGVLFGGAL